MQANKPPCQQTVSLLPRRSFDPPLAFQPIAHGAGRHGDDCGGYQVGGFPPYPISYRAIVPKTEECTNLLVPVAMSASHIAYGSIRMEPVFMILGQSAATAAALAIDANVDAQDVDYQTLAERLRAEGQILATTNAAAHR